MSLKSAIRSLIPHSMVNSLWHLPKAVFWSYYYGFPSRDLKIIGVTGTDGKTTTASMLYHILHQNGFKVALISTVSAKIGNKEIDTGFHVTSPAPGALQKLLKQIVSQKYEYVVLEVTSHGLAQHRLWGVKFTGGVVTNITEDHLLYHKTWNNYVAAKAKLFAKTQFSVLNREDKSYDYLKNKVIGKIITYGYKKGDWNTKNNLVKINMIGDYNQLNALAAGAAASELGITKTDIEKTITKFPGVLGRMQIMKAKPYHVIVDFAHTPNALDSALTTLRQEFPKSRLIAIFGCAGLRDKNRRKMGQVAAQKANLTIITAEDPRTEGVVKISDEIAVWAQKGGAKEITKDGINHVSVDKQAVYVKIPDRQKAFNLAVKNAQVGDVIGIFGKGHEQSMCFGQEESLWTDQGGVKKVFKKYGKK